MKSWPASWIQNYCLILSLLFRTLSECVVVPQVPAGVFGSGHWRGHLSLQGPDCGWRSRGLFRYECGRLLGVPSGRHAQIPEGARRTKQFCHPRDNSETLWFTRRISWIFQCFKAGFVLCQSVAIAQLTVPILSFQSNRKQSMNYGCIVKNEETHEVTSPQWKNSPVWSWQSHNHELLKFFCFVFF